MSCYSLEAFLELGKDGVLPSDVREHVRACARCERRWKVASETLDLVSDRSLRARIPEGLRRALRSIPTTRRGGAVTEIIAHAVPEPGVRVPIRGSTGAAPVQLLYRVGAYEVDLCLDAGALIGQVLPLALVAPPQDWAGAYCMLYIDGGVRTCDIGPNGEFDLQGVQPGTFDLAIEATALSLVLKGVSFDEDPGVR